MTLRVAITDKGYDGRSNRAAARTRGITSMIPRKANSKQRRPVLSEEAPLRTRIEQTMGKLKRFKRFARRCDETTASFTAFASFACSIMLITSVHTT
jgi:transposase